VNGYGRIVRLALKTVAIAAAVALLVSGCSDIIYPAVHDMPTPRADTTMTPDQVKQATDDLISERDHLSTEAQAAVQPASDSTGSTTAAARKAASSARPAVIPAVMSSATQSAGADTKP